MTTVAEQTITYLPLAALHAHPDNPRTDLGDLSELTQSIREQGIIAPVVVVPGVLDGQESADHYFIVAGHRRVAAARVANSLNSVPCIIRRDLGEAQIVETMLVENVQRADLTPMEQARGLQNLADLGLSQRDIARRTGIAQGTVSKRLSLLNLPTSVAAKVDSGGITVRDAEVLASVKDPGLVEAAVKMVTEGHKADEAVAQAKARQHAERKRQAAEEDAKVAGAVAPNEHQQKRLHNMNPVQNGDVRNHAGHLLFTISASGDLRFYCGKPSAHPDPERAAKDAEKSAKEARKAGLAAGGVERLRLVRDLVKGSDQRKCEARTAHYVRTRYGVTEVQDFGPIPRGKGFDVVAWALLALGVEPVEGQESWAALREFTHANGAKAVTMARLSWALVLGEWESDLSWHLADGFVTERHERCYLAEIGYMPNEHEVKTYGDQPISAAASEVHQVDDTDESDGDAE